MSRIRYGVAMSLDGYISGPNGDTDWIVNDPEVDFGEIWSQFDTLIMGRKTYGPAVARLGKSAFQGVDTVVVVSRTLRQADHPELVIMPELNRERIHHLRKQSKKDIWLSGGGELFRSMLELGEVDAVDAAIMPVLLGGGIPFLPVPALQT
jgi:dihydrofolate reductase